MEKKGTNMKQEVIKKAYEAAVAKNADPRVIESLKGKLSNSADENKCNSKENAMDKTAALKKKILLSNASDAVKAKAIKKVVENGLSERQQNIAIQAAKDAALLYRGVESLQQKMAILKLPFDFASILSELSKVTKTVERAI
jgi:hypothetical protein